MPERGLGPRNGSRDVAQYGRDPFSVFRREMDDLFDQFVSPFMGRGEGGVASTRWPSIDVEETESAYKVTAEIPGMDANDIDLNLRDNVLTLSGEKRQEQTSEEGGRKWTERSYGKFQRAIPFETEIDADRIEANCRNGVLTITLPKSVREQEKARRIEIKAN